MKKDPKDMAPADMIRALEVSRGEESQMFEFEGPTGHAWVKMAQAVFPDADLMIRVRSPKHRAYVGMSSGLMASNPEVVKVLEKMEHPFWSADAMAIPDKVIRFFGVAPKEAARVLELLKGLRPAGNGNSSTTPIHWDKVNHLEGVAGRSLEWTTYPDLQVFAKPTKATAIKLGDQLPSVVLGEDGSMLISTATDYTPVSLHRYVMAWNEHSRSYQQGPFVGEKLLVNHVLGRGERVSYRLVQPQEVEEVERMIASVIDEASSLFDQLAAIKGVNPESMN